MRDHEAHAVRWARRVKKFETQYTNWHWTLDSNKTICNRYIPVGNEHAFLPETDGFKEIVDCKICLGFQKTYSSSVTSES